MKNNINENQNNVPSELNNTQINNPSPLTGDVTSTEKQEVVSAEENKGAQLFAIIMTIAFVGAVAFCLYKYVFNNTSSNSTTPTPNNSNNSNTEANELAKYNGVYELDSSEIKLYAKNKSRIMYDYSSVGSSVSGWFEYDNNVLTSKIFDTVITISLESDGLVLTCNDDSAKSGTYTKKSDYSLDDYFADTYGDPQYFSTKYNGKYTNDKEYLYVYQSKENEIVIYGFIDKNYFVNLDAKIISDGYAEEGNRYEITFKDDKLTLVINDEERYEHTFTREKTITKEEVLENVYR